MWESKTWAYCLIRCFMEGMAEYYEYVCYASCFKKTVEG